MNWPVLIIVGIVALALIVFLTSQNIKDEKKFEKQLKDDYHKSKDEEGDTDVEVPLK